MTPKLVGIVLKVSIPKNLQIGTKMSLEYKSERNHVYWKIGLSLQDVNLAREKIMNLGTSQVSPPAQFFNIGYLCHLSDPEGFSIELLQHTFEKNFVKSPLDTTGSMVLGQNCLIGQI